jgi:hypothetical protein
MKALLAAKKEMEQEDNGPETPGKNRKRTNNDK